MHEITASQQITMPASADPTLTRALDVVLSGAVVKDGEVHLLPGKGLLPEHRWMASARLSTLSRSLDARDRRAASILVSRYARGISEHPSGGR